MVDTCSLDSLQAVQNFGEHPLFYICCIFATVVGAIAFGVAVTYFLNYLIDRKTNPEVPHIDENHPKTADDLDELIHSDLVRPPYGRIKPSQFRELKKKYRVVFWDVITRDYNRHLSPNTVFRIIHWYCRSGSIVVFHDSKKAEKNMLAVLPRAIEFWQKKNYKFGLL